MQERGYGHNEIVCRVPRPVKRRFMQICKQKKRRPDDLGGEIIKDWVFYYTPPISQSKYIRWLTSRMEENRKGIYLFFTAMCFMFVGAIFIISMIGDKSTLWIWVWMFCLVIVMLFFAKIFLMLSKMK